MGVCRQLHTIILGGNQVGDSALSILQKWRARLREIDLSGNRVTDSGFSEIRAEFGNSYKGFLPYLKRLSLRRNELSDECAFSFPLLHSLKWLDLRNNHRMSE